MKIYRFKDAPMEMGEGYSLRVMTELALNKCVASISFYRLTIPPNGKLPNHYHSEVTEFLFFQHPGRIRCGAETFDLYPGDIAAAFPGEAHEIFAGPEGISPLVIKVPNNQKDLVILESKD